MQTQTIGIVLWMISLSVGVLLLLHEVKTLTKKIETLEKQASNLDRRTSSVERFG